ncbi:MAG: DUF4173 domain-containing protein [Microscillaceae bacterium]|nr:DUF4173 domain-containing protein [Microscillaceae bacterium]
MNDSKTKFWILMLLVTVYNFFFWGEKLGLNLFLFSGMLLGALYYFYPGSWEVKHVKVSFAFTLIAMFMVLIYNSLIAKIALFGSLAVTVAVFQERRLQSLMFAVAYSGLGLLYSLWKMVTVPLEIPEKLPTQIFPFKKAWRRAKLTVIPVFTFGIFFLILEEANPVLDKISFKVKMFFIENTLTLAQLVYVHFSVVKFFFLLFGIWLVSACLYRRPLGFLVHLEKSKSEQIQRKRLNYKKLGLSISMIALKNEYSMALVMLVLVNALLVVVNMIDISWLWFGFEYGKVDNFKDLVHKGTHMLILSILLSMGILLYFFRKNLNFYKRNTLLKKLSYLWIIQNGILTFSVALRTYYYIHQYGLAYKRIGLLIFLALTLFGLYSLFMKIYTGKSVYYLLKINSWALYTVLILMSLIDWDVWMVQYNIDHYYRTGKMDKGFLLSHADKTLPLIHAQVHLLDCSKEPEVNCQNRIYQEKLKSRIQVYMNKQKYYTWLSWNYSDYKTDQYLKEVTLNNLIKKPKLQPK